MLAPVLRYVSLAIVFITAAGCATTGGELSDAEQVANVIKQYEQGLTNQDVDMIMELVSNNLESASKADVRAFWEDYKAQGILDGIEVDTEETETEIDGDSALVGPLYLVSPAGSLTQDFSLRKEADGVSRVSDVIQY